MVLTLREIHTLEMAEDYPAAIDALEDRLREDPTECETVVRLGFNLWYAVAEAMRFKVTLPTDLYAARFIELYEEYKDRFMDNADFCWAFGLGMSLFPYFFCGVTEDMGNDWLDRAKRLDSFWQDMPSGDFAQRFTGRGIFEKYYGTR